jgi:LacI family transcriptional regulator
MQGKTTKRITSRDIARAAGVSQPTVSRALRGDPRVAPATVALIEATAQRLGYVPDVVARSLITRRTQTIAVVIADITNPFYPHLVHAAHENLGRLGYRTVLLNERTDAPTMTGVGQLLRAGGLDGAMIATATLDRRTRELIAQASIPIVLLNREVDGVETDVVVSNNRDGGALIAELLTRLGHDRIGVISGPTSTSTARDRNAGFTETLDRLDVLLRPDLWRTGDYSHRSGYQACLELLKLAAPPTAIFCGNDVIALGALDAARRCGVRVPAELSIIGFDDIALAGWESFQLSTVRQPLEEMAHAATSMLVERIESGASPPPRRIQFPTQLIQRATTATVATQSGRATSHGSSR